GDPPPGGRQDGRPRRPEPRHERGRDGRPHRGPAARGADGRPARASFAGARLRALAPEPGHRVPEDSQHGHGGGNRPFRAYLGGLMEFAINEYADFRKEVEDWCFDRWPGGFGPAYRGGNRDHAEWEAITRETQQALGAKGWLCGGWPVEYGGGNWPKVK